LPPFMLPRTMISDASTAGTRLLCMHSLPLFPDCVPEFSPVMM
jgi:hypothetical protein